MKARKAASMRPRIHPAMLVATVAFVALLGAAGFRAAPSVLMIPLQDEFGWSRGLLSVAVGVNLVLFGLTAPFAAALMDRFGVRRVVACALILVAARAAGSRCSFGTSGSSSRAGACWSASAPVRWRWCSRPPSRPGGSFGAAAW